MVLLFRIGEFSKLTQVSVRMLRYYDEVGLFRPACVDRYTGYRLYTVEQIPALHKIVFLRDTGFGTAEIASVMNEPKNTSAIGQLEKKQKEIEAAILSEQEKLGKIRLAIKEMEQEKAPISYGVTVKGVQGFKVLSLRRIIPDYFAEGALWGELARFARRNGAPVIREEQNFAIYHDVEYKDSDVDVEVCAAVDELMESSGEFIYRETEPVTTMACMMVYGPFENIAGAYASFAAWLQRHNQFRMEGENRQICHCGPWNEENPKRYLTEIQIPVQRL